MRAQSKNDKRSHWRLLRSERNGAQVTYSWGNIYLLLIRKWKNFPLDLNYSLVKNCAETTTWCNTATSGSGQLNSEHEVLDHYAEMDWLMVLSLITFELNIWLRLNWRFDYVWIECLITFELKIWLRLNWRGQINSDIVPVMFPID